MKTLEVMRPFPYAGQRRKKGDKIEATNSHAKILCTLGKARLVEEEVARTEPLARRDMRAEETGSTLSLPSRSARRGRYARSDMSADK